MTQPQRQFTTKLQVRGYELDGYGHVNNAVYLNYFEYARWNMLEEAGLGTDYFKRHGVFPTVVRVEIDYRESCYLAEDLVIETTLFQFRKRVAIFEQKLKKEKTGALAARALITVVVVGGEGRAVSLPADFEAHFYGVGAS